MTSAAQPTISRAVRFGRGLLLLSGVLVLLGLGGYRLGLAPLGVGLLTFALGVLGAAVATLLSLIGLVLTLRRPAAGRRGTRIALISAVAGAVVVSIPASLLIGAGAAPIHDITTDTAAPPQFVAVVPLNTPGRTVYEGEAIASQQRAAYPDLQPVSLAMPPAAAFARALEVVEEMGWELVEADPAAGRIEATDTTFWFGFKDDVVIRVAADGDGSRIDVRSLSRVGGGDVGANANRIRRYVAALTLR